MFIKMWEEKASFWVGKRKKPFPSFLRLNEDQYELPSLGNVAFDLGKCAENLHLLYFFIYELQIKSANNAPYCLSACPAIKQLVVITFHYLLISLVMSHNIIKVLHVSINLRRD